MDVYVNVERRRPSWPRPAAVRAALDSRRRTARPLRPTGRPDRLRDEGEADRLRPRPRPRRLPAAVSLQQRPSCSRPRRSRREMRLARRGRLRASGRALVKVACPKAETSGPCHGTVTLSRGKKRLGRASFQRRRRRRGPVGVRLPRSLTLPHSIRVLAQGQRAPTGSATACTAAVRLTRAARRVPPVRPCLEGTVPVRSGNLGVAEAVGVVGAKARRTSCGWARGSRRRLSGSGRAPRIAPAGGRSAPRCESGSRSRSSLRRGRGSARRPHPGAECPSRDQRSPRRRRPRGSARRPARRLARERGTNAFAPGHQVLLEEGAEVAGRAGGPGDVGAADRERVARLPHRVLEVEVEPLGAQLLDDLSRPA